MLTGEDAEVWPTLNEGRRTLLLRMRSEFEVNHACAVAGIRSLDDLPTDADE